MKNGILMPISRRSTALGVTTRTTSQHFYGLIMHLGTPIQTRSHKFVQEVPFPKPSAPPYIAPDELCKILLFCSVSRLGGLSSSSVHMLGVF
jgi:hypothetical protein